MTPSTLAEPQIEKLGKTRFTSSASPDELAEGARAAILRMEPESGPTITAVVVPSAEDAKTVAALFYMLSERDDDVFQSVRAQLLSETGYEIDWADWHRRFDEAQQHTY